MTETMQALVLRGPDDFGIEEVPVPEPGAMEVLCRVHAVSICGTDSHLIAGHYPGFWPPTYPIIPGHEWAGEIVKLGPGAEQAGWKVGDRVAGTSHDACGVCQACVEGRYNLCQNYGVMDLHRQYGHNWQGADAEYVVHGVKTVFPLPDDISYEVGAVIDPASIALHTARRGHVQPGDDVVVLGAGPVGLLGADAALAMGAGQVIVVGRGLRLQKAIEMGFKTVDSNAVDVVETVRDMTGGLGPAVVLEAAGTPTTITWALKMLRKGGRIATVGIPTEGLQIDMRDLVLYELELAGSRASAGEMRRVMPLVADGRIRLKDIMTHEFALADFADALATFRDKTSGAIKITIKP
ncbi:MAG: alcohol dehydrogenase catalytic domain-containing protein [Candidatus Limnocylindrales bacterium]